MAEVNGTCVFDCMLSYWSRFIGISPYFGSPIKLTVEHSRIVDIEGGEEAEALKRFLAKMSEPWETGSTVSTTCTVASTPKRAYLLTSARTSFIAV